jgi:hypothetical protein
MRAELRRRARLAKALNPVGKDTMIMQVPMPLMLAAIIVWPEIPLFLPKLIAPELLK